MTILIAPNWRSRMSERRVDDDLMALHDGRAALAAPMKYGAMVIRHESSAAAWARAWTR
jgi:hypothetical protein